MMLQQSATNRHAMKVLGLPLPPMSHLHLVRQVAAAAATVAGFGLGGWLFGMPIDRESAIALFVGFLYIGVADRFLAMRDAKVKRYALAAAGAGMLIATAALLEQLIQRGA